MRNLVLILSLALLAGCGGDQAAPPESHPRAAFLDLVDHHGVPAAAEDWSFMPLADRGAWFGFGLAPGDRPDLGAGFTGPQLLTDGHWLGSQLVGLEIDGVDPGAGTVEGSGLPGALAQRWQAGDLVVEQALWFDSAQVALIQARILNHGDVERTVEVAWTGAVFADAATLAATRTGILARTPAGDRAWVVADRALGEVTIDGDRYRAPLAGPVTVAPQGSAVFAVAVAVDLAGEDGSSFAAAEALERREQSLQLNTQRWNDWVTATAPAGEPDDPRRIVAVKAVQTLVGNWRAPAGRFEHGGLFPSSNVSYFNGFWAWDSWKHAVGLARFAPDIAAQQLRLMAAQQDDAGMIADVVYLDASEDNWRGTKPPLLGWALAEVFEATSDTMLVHDLYPVLVRYHEWWYAHRDHDGDGLCEYGSTDGTIVAARWESGMDNAVRFDQTTMLQNGLHAWSMDQESVDLNSYLYREKVALTDLASVLGRTGHVQRWAGEAVELRERIQAAMFDDETGWFHDLAIDGSAFVPVRGPEGWIPLWAGVATAEQAARMREVMLDEVVFRTHVPFPTVAADHPEFSDGYWRGLVWLDQVWFAIDGLRSYGYTGEADALTDQVLANLAGVAEPGVPLRENYHPLTGEGRNANHFSWTAAHLLLLALER